MTYLHILYHFVKVVRLGKNTESGVRDTGHDKHMQVGLEMLNLKDFYAKTYISRPNPPGARQAVKLQDGNAGLLPGGE